MNNLSFKSNVFKVFVCIVLVCSLLLVSACGGKDTKEAKKDNDKDGGSYRFSYTTGWDKAQGAIPPEKAPEDPHFQYIEKKLGVVPLTQPYDWEGGIGYEKQVRLQLSGQKIPEAMEVFSEDFLSQLIDMKILQPLDDLLPKYAPDYWKQLTDEDKELLRSFSPDGKIYCIAWKSTEPRVGMIRKDWLDNLGLKVPTTKEELLNVYEAFLKKDANGNGDPNDEIPVSGREGLRWCDDLFVMHGVSMYEGHPQWRWNEEKQQLISDQVSDEMKNALTFLADIYKKGYMDTDMPVQKGSDWFAKIQKDTVGHYFHTISGLERRLAMKNEGQDGKAALNPKAEFAYMPNVKVDGIDQQPNYAGGLDIELVISKKAKDPAKILKWWNWIWTEEGIKYKFNGIEGENYTVDSNGKIVATENPLSNKHAYVMKAGNRTRDIYEGLNHGENMISVFEASKDDVQYYDNKFMPSSVYKDFTDYTPDSAKLYREIASKIVVGDLSIDEAWDKYVKEWYEKGGTEVTKRATEWYKELHKK